jgi:hypothetical protein
MIVEAALLAPAATAAVAMAAAGKAPSGFSPYLQFFFTTHVLAGTAEV